MRRPLPLAAALATLLAGIGGQVVAAPGNAASSGQASAPSSALATITAAAVSARGVTLITGDSVRLATDPHGHPRLQGIPAHGATAGPGGAFQTLIGGGHAYAIPASARPYLGRLLDPALFDVARLSAAHLGSRTPVRLTFSGSAVPSVPGVTITSTSAGAASGYVTASSSRTFGAALAARYAADAKAHFPKRTTLFGTTGVFADLPVTPVVTPKYPMRTLIIKVLDTAGAAAPFAFVDVFNADDGRKLVGFAIAVDGEARVSVPLGTYDLDTSVDRIDTTGNFAGVSILDKNDYVVSGQNQTVVLDGREATSRVSVTTPRPADADTEEFDVQRIDALGGTGLSAGFALLGGGPLAIWVTPAAPVKTGLLQSTASWTLTGSPASGTPYAYSLYFAQPGIPADEAHPVAAAAVSTIKAHYYVDSLRRNGFLFRIPLLPGPFGLSAWATAMPLPGNRVEYVNAIDGAVWLDSLIAPPDEFSNPFAGAVDDGPRLALASATRSVEWLRGPYLPNIPVETNGYAAFGGYTCLACRTSDTLGVVLAFATDSTPGHTLETFGNLDGTPVARFRIYQDGALIADESDSSGGAFTVPAKAATYRIVEEVNRVPSSALLSLTTRTEITFGSAAGQGGKLPASWNCPVGISCTVLPLLRTAVALPVNLVGSVPLGASSVVLTVAHIKGAPAPAITSGRVEIRRPGGAWTKLPILDLGGGQYRATLTTTSADAGSALDLRVTGTDAAGGRIVQTATAAFTVSTS